jgi:D-amino peptidase
MTKEVNSAILGAFNGGASVVDVWDWHWDGRTIILNELDKRSSLISGHTTINQIKELFTKYDAIGFIGFHGSAGSSNSVIEHTMYFHIQNVFVNGESFDEMKVLSIVPSSLNIPIIFVSGDATTCEYGKKYFKNIENVITKYSYGRESAKLRPITEVHEEIEKKFEIAVRKLREKKEGGIIDIKYPAKIKIDFNNQGMADRAEMMPKTNRINGRSVEYEANDALELFRAFLTLQKLGMEEEQ